MASANVALFILTFATGCSRLLVIGAAYVVRVNYGYFPESRPVRVACARGLLNYQIGNTEYKVTCYPQTSGLHVLSRLDSYQLDISDLGSAPLAMAASRGIDISVIYITDYKGDAQGIYVRPSEDGLYKGIENPLDLEGRVVGVPFGSTMHYQVLYLLDLFGLTGKVKLLNLSPVEIIDAWDAKTIDAAACWGTTREYVLQETVTLNGRRQGRTLISSGVMADWGRPTFGVVVANRKFLERHPEFAGHFANVFGLLTDSFIDRLGEQDPHNVARWVPKQDGTTSFMPSLADSLMEAGEKSRNPSGPFVNQQRRSLDLFIQQSIRDQISCNYLAAETGGLPCGKPSQVNVAIRQTAEFLLDQKAVFSLEGLSSMGNDQNCSANDELCGRKILNGNILEQGSSANSATTLASITNGSAAFPPFEIGRAGANEAYSGDSTCVEGTEWFLQPGDQQYIADGANATKGRSYSDGLRCSWQIYQDETCTNTKSCDGILRITFDRVRVWSDDYIRIYSDPSYACTPESTTKRLLAQISGTSGVVPPFESANCVLVEFVTDRNQERSYGDSENRGDGFRATVSRRSPSCGNCQNGFLCDTATNMCKCDGVHWGADCSLVDYCIGTSHLFVQNTSRQQIASSYDHRNFLNGTSFYRNDLDCMFEINTLHGFIVLEVEYDLETTFDNLEVHTGSFSSEESPTLFLVLTGASVSRETYYIPADESGFVTIRLKTDSRGRRRGFSGAVWTNPDLSGYFASRRACTEGRSGINCEISHCIQQNSLDDSIPTVVDARPNYFIGRVKSQVGDTIRPIQMSCSWPLSSFSAPTDAGSIQLVFNAEFDLEPHPASAIGDKLLIKSNAGETEIFAEKCTSDEQCSHDWQTGTCDSWKGSCAVKTSFNISTVDFPSAEALLITDRNDRGQTYRGIDFDLLFVRECPRGDGQQHCERMDGAECVGGLCLSALGELYSCPCTGVPLVDSFDPRPLAAIIASLVALFALVFWCYRRRKIEKSRAQKAVIAEKEEMLETFRNSVVGMRTATKHYLPKPKVQPRLSTKLSSFENPIPPPLPAPKVQWCWKETPHMMTNYSPAMIVGNPVDCWIKYEVPQSHALETAYQAYINGRQLNSSRYVHPLTGYKVDLQKFTQIKESTGFRREVKRHLEVMEQPDDSMQEDIDLNDVTVGGNLPEDIICEPQIVLVKGDVVQISSQRQDGWAFGTKLHHHDESVARQLVQLANTSTTGDESNVFTDTGWFPLDCTEMPSSEDLALLQHKVGDSASLEAPSHWATVEDPSVVQRHALNRKDDEYKRVVSAFMSTLKPPAVVKIVKIVKVERIQNLAMWQSYVVKRQTICYRESGANASEEVQRKAMERFERHWVWHGTNVEVMGKILQQGFNRSFCGKNATKYGKGVYFARDASFSASPMYSVPDRNKDQYIMACRVIVGEYCLGVEDALTPGIRDRSKHTLYDSTVGLMSGDEMANPSIYVTYHDAQAYPDYLIKFRLV